MQQHASCVHVCAGVCHCMHVCASVCPHRHVCACTRVPACTHVCTELGGTKAGTQRPRALHRAVLRGGGERSAALGLFLLLPELRQPQHGHCDSCQQTNTQGCSRGLQTTVVEVVAFVTSLSKLGLVRDAECSRAGAESITEQPQRHGAVGKHSSTVCLGGSVLNSCHVCAEGYCSPHSCWGHGDSGCTAQHPAGMDAGGGLGSPSASCIGAGVLGACRDLGACWGAQRCLNMRCSIAGMLEHARMPEDAGTLGCAGMPEHAEVPVCSDAPACKDSCTHRTPSLQCLEAAASSRAPPLPPTERDQEGTGPGTALSQPRRGGPHSPELRARAGARRGCWGGSEAFAGSAQGCGSPRPPPSPRAVRDRRGAERSGAGPVRPHGRGGGVSCTGAERGECGAGVARLFLFLGLPNAAQVLLGGGVPGAAVLPLCPYYRPGPSHAAMPAEPLVCADTATR